MRITIMCIAIVFSGAVLAADLDAPLQKREPTMRSEMERGSTAAADCAAILELASLDRCLDRIESAVRLRNELNDAFSLGLNTFGLMSMTIVYDVRSSGRGLPAYEQEFAQGATRARLKKIRGLQEALKLDDDQLCTALLKSNPSRCLSTLARWGS